jgi:hypothetical protein
MSVSRHGPETGELDKTMGAHLIQRTQRSTSSLFVTMNTYKVHPMVPHFSFVSRVRPAHEDSYWSAIASW